MLPVPPPDIPPLVRTLLVPLKLAVGWLLKLAELELYVGCAVPVAVRLLPLAVLSFHVPTDPEVLTKESPRYQATKFAPKMELGSMIAFACELLKPSVPNIT